MCSSRCRTYPRGCYTRRLLDNADWAELIRPPKPLHVLPYAYAVKPGDDAWLQTMEKFVERPRNGQADAARTAGDDCRAHRAIVAAASLDRVVSRFAHRQFVVVDCIFVTCVACFAS